MKFLITGGAGFIGSHLAEELLAQGHRVHVLDDLSTGSIDNIRPLKADARFGYTIDTCASPGLVAELVDEADIVYHLAAAVGVDLVVESPVRTIETNVHCTEVVLAQAAKKRKPVFIASTSEVYGKSKQLPLREDGDLVMGPSTTGAGPMRARRRSTSSLRSPTARSAGCRPSWRRAAADRALRDGHADGRRRGALEPAVDGLRRRDPDALLLPRR